MHYQPNADAKKLFTFKLRQIIFRWLVQKWNGSQINADDEITTTASVTNWRLYCFNPRLSVCLSAEQLLKKHKWFHKIWEQADYGPNKRRLNVDNDPEHIPDISLYFETVQYVTGVKNYSEI